MQKGYKARFFDDLLKNLHGLQGQITIDEKGHVTESLKNTCLFARALHKTFGDAGDVAGLMLMNTACDYSPLLEELKVHSIVMIYEDPITEQKPEGKACLLHKIGDVGGGLERWKVCFDGEDGGVYERTIKGKK